MTKKIINMKKITTTIIVFMSIFAAYSQNQSNQIAENTQEKCEPHRIFIHLGTGYANSIYDNINESFLYKNYSIGSMLEFKYGYFFTKEYGISVGIGLAHFAAQATLNNEGMIQRYDDPFFDPDGVHLYDLYYKFDHVVEKQQIWALELPLQFHFEHLFNHQHGIMASLGLKGYFPVLSAKNAFSEGNYIEVKGYEAFTDTWYTTPPHFGKKEVTALPKSVKLRCSVDIIGEFGGVIRLNEKCNFYIGAYANYGFLDILPKTSDKKEVIAYRKDAHYTVNHLLESDFLSEYNKYVETNNLNWKKITEKWHRWQIGVKIGIHIKP